MGEISLKGICDMHVHTSPDLRQRTYDDFALTDAAVRVGARAIVIKSHLGFTVNRACLCNLYNQRMHPANDFTMYGGAVLNSVIGGINPYAADRALRLGGKVIWLPTQSAENHMAKLGGNPGEAVPVVRDGKVVPELLSVFSLIKDHDAVLGTGHISPAEARIAVEAARDAGVKKIVITHPEWWLIGMSTEEQLRLVRDYDVILERCYAQNMGNGVYRSNLQDNLEIIREAGFRHVMADTDGGQTENPRWENALYEYVQYLTEHGISADAVYYMTRTIPYRLLGIDSGRNGTASGQKDSEEV